MIKFITGWALVFLIRLIPFRAPNIEPVLATLMPFSKQYGAVGAFLFGAMSITLFDAVTSGLGTWTAVTAAAYGLLGIASYYFFRDRASSRLNYVIFAVVGTLAYDAATGLTIGPIFYGQSFAEAFYGQIPFTMWHLLGNISFALAVSPAIYRWVVTNPKLETKETIRILTRLAHQ